MNRFKRGIGLVEARRRYTVDWSGQNIISGLLSCTSQVNKANHFVTTT